jgi:hypothetical protein
MRVRPAVALASAVLGLTALSGCEKPTPLVTVTSGSSSVHTEAACYEEDGQISRESCSDPGAGAPEIGVSPNGYIGVGVDPEVADAGWQITVNGQQVTPQPLDTTYYRIGPIPAQFLAQGPIELNVASQHDGQVNGLWLVRVREG